MSVVADPDAPRSVRFGIALTHDPPSTRARLDRFCEKLAGALGVAVEPKALWHYHHLVDGLDAGEIEFAWLPPLVALRATASRRVVPVALPSRNGSAAYSAALFVREDSAVKTLADLHGLRAAWVDRQSAAGYLLVRALLKARGVDVDLAFDAEQFLGAHDAVARAVVEGDADVGATYAHLDEAGQVLRAGWGQAKVRVLASVGPIPADVIAASIRVPVPLTRALRDALLGAGDVAATARDLFGAEGFVAARAEHLDALTGLLSSIEDVSANIKPYSIPPA